MLEMVIHNVQIQHVKLIYLFALIFICSMSIVSADSQHNQTATKEKDNPLYLSLGNLSDISLVELKQIKQTRNLKIASLLHSVETLETSEGKLLKSLIAYDDVQLQIADIILKLTDEYKVTGKYKKKLLGYSKTFKTRIKPARGNLQTLDEYKVYSTHFSVAYISLLYAFKENPKFYQQYMNDINDPVSTIGKYRRELAILFRKVEQAQKEYESMVTVRDLEQSVEQLDREIKVRETRLSAQYRVDLNL